jgi:hypothetical protein
MDGKLIVPSVGVAACEVIDQGHRLRHRVEMSKQDVRRFYRRLCLVSNEFLAFMQQVKIFG